VLWKLALNFLMIKFKKISKNAKKKEFETHFRFHGNSLIKHHA
jgi:hypothetical protein